jgi:hypothetical protein
MTDPFDSDPSTSDPSTSDPFEVLRSHVRAVAVLERPSTDPDDLIAGIVALEPPNGALVDGSASNVVVLRSPRRRRWLAAGGAVAIVVAGGAGVAAFRGEKPGVPSADLLCRASPDGEGSSVALQMGDDPVGQCAALWATGRLPDLDGEGETKEVPRLVACTGAGRTLEVVPLPPSSTCADIGLADADVSGPLNSPEMRMQSRLVDEVNRGQCLDARAAADVVARALSEFGLERWTVEVKDADAGCVIVAIEPETERVVVLPDPTNTRN